MNHLSGEAAALLIVGMILSLTGWIWLVVLGFRIGPLWGLSTIVCPTFAAPCFALDHWKKTRVPLGIHLAGVALIVIVRLMNG